MSWYPEITDPDFDRKLLRKQEFREDTKKIEGVRVKRAYSKSVYSDAGIYQEPYQQFVRKFINRDTPYNSILLYHGLGTGKTTSAISVMENFHDLVLKTGGLERFLVITKNKTLQDMFVNEIIKYPYSPYLTSKEREMIASSSRDASILKNRVLNKIKNYYEFVHYDEMVNIILGRSFTIEVTGESRRDKMSSRILNLDNRIIVVDEIQNVTGNNRYVALMRLLRNARNVRLILLTGTPIVDSAEEIVYIANLLNFSSPVFDLDENALDINKKLDKQLSNNMETLVRDNVLVKRVDPQFGRQFTEFTREGEKILESVLRGRVSYTPLDPGSFPKKIRMGTPLSSRPGSVKIVPCVMSEYQKRAYEFSLTMNTTFYQLQSEVSTMVYESDTIDGAISSVNLDRTSLMLQNIGKYSCKLYSILVNINKSRGPAFVYSNNVEVGGTKLVAEALRANGYTEYDGKTSGKSYVLLRSDMNDSERNSYIKIINSPENADGSRVKVIIGSPFIAEGVSFLRVRQVHILEPYWNITRTLQAEGRCVRNHSHDGLPASERTVEIYWYAAVSDVNTVDVEKYKVCEIKDRINKRIDRLMKRIAVDCYNTRKLVENSRRDNREAYDEFYKDYSMECDYEKCDYTCKYVDDKDVEDLVPRKASKHGSSSRKTDNLTYNAHTDPMQVKLAKARIRNLFLLGNAWDVNQIMRRPELADITEDNVYYALQQMLGREVFVLEGVGPGVVEQTGKYYRFIPTDPRQKKQARDLTEFFGTMQISQPQASSSSVPVVPVPAPLSVPASPSRPKPTNPVLSMVNQIAEFSENAEADVIGIIKDNKFLLADVSKNRDIRSGREQNRGRVCSTFKKEDVVKFGQKLGMKLNANLTKQQLCKQIYLELEKRKHIFTE